MRFGDEADLIPVVNRLTRQAGSVGAAIELLEPVLAHEIGGAVLFVEPADNGGSPQMAEATAAFPESRQFPFRGLYTAPLKVGNKTVGRLIACFGSFGVPGKALPLLTSHVAEQLSRILAQTSRLRITAQPITVQPEAA